MKYRAEDIEKLNNELNIVEVIGEYVDLKRAGSSYKGLCPFHNEKTPSFNVSPAKNIYKCFGCNASGNAVTFYMEYNNLDYITAVKELAEKYNIDIRPVAGDYDVKVDKNENIYKVLETAMNIFKQNLLDLKGKKALEYLYNRGLEDKFIKKYDLGYSERSWDALGDQLLGMGYSQEDIFKAGLSKKGEKGFYDTFRDRVIFPIYSPYGKIVGFGGRAIDENQETAKYLNSPETDVFIKGKNLYGIIEKGNKLRRNDYAILMEGYMDVITAHSYGFDMAVATLGTSLTDDQAKLLMKYTKNIIIAYDMDEAGRNAIRRACFILKRYDFNIRVLELTGAKDPDEYLKKYGKESFVEELKKSKESFDFFYENYLKEIDISTIIGKKALVEKFNEFFESLSNKIEYTLYIDKLAKNLEIDKNILQEYIKPLIKDENQSYNYNFTEQKRKKFNPLELATVRIILKNRKYYEELKGAKLQDLLLRQIVNYIGENYHIENIEYSILHNNDFLEYNQEDLVEIIYGVETIENESEFFSEIKYRWEMIEKQEREKEISRILKEEDLTIEERKTLIYERVEIIKSLKRKV